MYTINILTDEDTGDDNLLFNRFLMNSWSSKSMADGDECFLRCPVDVDG